MEEVKNYPISIKRNKNSTLYYYSVEAICEIFWWNPDELDEDGFKRNMSIFLRDSFEDSLPKESDEGKPPMQNMPYYCIPTQTLINEIFKEKPCRIYELELFHMFDTVRSLEGLIENPYPSYNWSSNRRELELMWRLLKKRNENKEYLTSNSSKILSEDSITIINGFLQGIYDKISDKSVRTRLYNKIEIAEILISLQYVEKITRDNVYDKLANALFFISWSNSAIDNHETSDYYRGEWENKKNHIQENRERQKQHLTRLNELIEKLTDGDIKSTFNEIRKVMRNTMKKNYIDIKQSLLQLQEESKEYNLTHAYDFFTYVRKTKRIKPDESREFTVTANQYWLFINWKNYLEYKRSVEERLLKEDFRFRRKS